MGVQTFQTTTLAITFPTKMWSIVSLFLLVTFAIAHPAWKESSEYQYEVQGRTLTGLHEVSDQYSGILFKAHLRVQPKSDGNLQAQLNNAQYAQVNSHLRNGWTTNIPQSDLSWKPLEISSKSFQIHTEDNEIKGLTVNADVADWEKNMIKGIVSQFQLKINDISQSEDISSYSNEQGLLSTFTVMEDTVTGDTATFYRVNKLPEYLAQNLPNSEEIFQERNARVYEVTKSKNYSLSADLPSYFYGFAGLENDRPATNQMGSFFTRSSFSRALLSGELNSYTIQNSYTVSEILFSPTLMDKQKGSVYSLVNVTLKNLGKQPQPIEEVLNPIRLGSLVYSHDKVSPKNPRWRTSLVYDYSQEQQDLNEGLLLPHTLGYNTVTPQEKGKIVQRVRDLSKEISEDVQNPFTMLRNGTMDKYTILNTLVRILNADELRLIADELYDARQASERDAWKIFRDSVAVCGTGPALLTIKEWILSSRIETVEASLVLSAMAKTVRQPSVHYLKTFFEFVKEPKVLSEWPLNDTALLSYSEFVRQIFIEERKAAVQYPAKTLKKIRSPDGIEFIKQTVIPFYSEQLHKAVSRAETHKIHVYIRVLGNMANPQILSAFKPYLDGVKPVSQYQRLLLVLALDKLTEFYPEHAKGVLLRLYQNVGENPDVRVAAVYQLMHTQPSAELLEYMASYTNVDPHDHVVTAVKTVIESAAELRGEEYQHIRQAAQAAKPLLTKKTFGIQNGGGFLRHHLVEELRVHFTDSLEAITSDEQLYPRGIKYSLEYNLGGLKNQLVDFRAVVSNIDELVHVFKQQTRKYSQEEAKQEQNYEQQAQQQWSSQHIAKLLNLEPEEREQPEGSLYVQYGLVQAMLSFDNTSVPAITKKLAQLEKELKAGKQIEFLKLQSEREMVMAFPLEMGFPFLYTYDTPSMMRIHGQVKAVANPKISQEKFHQPESIQITTDLTLTVTSKVQGRASFVTPFDQEQYLSGYDRHAQVHIPIDGKFQWNLRTKQIRVEFETGKSHDETRLLHYSTWPYTSQIKIMKFEPVSLQPKTQIIRQENLHSYDNVIGKKQTGLALRVQIQHETSFIDIQHLRQVCSKYGYTLGLMSLWNEAQIQHSQINVTYLQKESSTKEFSLLLANKQEYRAGSNSPSSLQQHELPNQQNPEEAQKAAIEKVSAGIKNVESEAYHLSLEFQGEKKIEHVVTAAYAKSNVDPKSRIFINYKKESDEQDEEPYVVVLEADNYVENTNGLNLKYSMENEPKIKREFQISFGPKLQKRSQIQVKYQYQRSEERKQYLRNQPAYKHCQIEMDQGNYQLPACANITAESNLLDQVEAKIRYENVSQRLKEFLKTVYHATHYNYYPNTELDSEQGTGREDEVTIQSKFEPDLRSVNVSVKSTSEKLTLRNIPVSDVLSSVLVPHPVFDVRSRLLAQALNLQSYETKCVVDQNKISTFLESVYPADLSDKWTVMFQYIPKHARHEDQPNNVRDQLEHQTENYAILVKKLSHSNQKKVKITLSSPETQFQVVDITLRPNQQRYNQPRAKVTVDGEDIQVEENSSFQYGQGFIQIYVLPNDEVKVEIRNQFYALYDGQRVALSLLNGKFGDSSKGICGQLSGEKIEDFLSPVNCIVQNHQKFIKSYEVEGSQGQQVRKELNSPTTMECSKKISPLHVKIVRPSKDEDFSAQVSGECLKFQTQYIEQYGEICFTLRPMPSCNRGCQPSSSAERKVPVHCIANSSVSQLWKNQIDNGGSPDFSHKSETRTESLQIPQNCA